MELSTGYQTARSGGRLQTALVSIGSPDVEVRGDLTRVWFPVSGLPYPELWFELPTAFADLLGTPTCDAALAALLVPAMANGRKCVVRGPVSPKLVWNIQETVIPVLGRLMPDLNPIDLEIGTYSSSDLRPGRNVLTPLSNRIDSLALLAEHLLSPTVRPQDRVTHVLFSDVGIQGLRTNARQIADRRWVLVEACARELAVPALRVRSNLDAFYSTGSHLLLTHSIRNAAIPLLLQHGTRRFMHPSSYTWNQLSATARTQVAFTDPFLLPALSTERIDLVSVGAKYDRIEKTERIASWDIAQRYLDVCVIGPGNCSECYKCMRTALTLDLLGHLDAFSRVFDLEVYRRNRESFLGDIWVESDDPHAIALHALAQQHGLKPSARQISQATIRRRARQLDRSTRQLFHSPWQTLPPMVRQALTPIANAVTSVFHR